MSKLLLFFTLTCLLALCWSESTEREGYCKYNDIYIKEGESSPSPLGTCNTITCNNAKNSAIIALTCPEFLARPGCSVGDYDYTQLYPNCCPREVC